MTRAAVLWCGGAAALLATAAFAQDADRVRLDDFAVPQSAAAPQRIEQLAPEDPTPLPQQAVDRTLARPAQSEEGGEMPAQLSVVGGGGAVAQLGSRSESRPAPGQSVSSTSDSKPGTVARIGGQDRCDPQLTQRFYAECLKILELRSDEFDAPQPAALSAEQRLLAEQRQREESLAGSSAALRLRYATAMQPDADLQSNQELAAIYFNEPTPTPPSEPAEAPEDGDLGDALKVLGIELTTPPPSGN